MSSKSESFAFQTLRSFRWKCILRHLLNIHLRNSVSSRLLRGEISPPPQIWNSPQNQQTTMLCSECKSLSNIQILWTKQFQFTQKLWNFRRKISTVSKILPMTAVHYIVYNSSPINCYINSFPSLQVFFWIIFWEDIVQKFHAWQRTW